MYEFFDHTADLGIRVRADDLLTLLKDAARGLFAGIVENLDDVQPVQQVTLSVEGEEPEYLLFDWLSELLHVFDSQRLLLCEFNLELSAGILRAECRGEPMDESRHRMTHEIKAITYHGLSVVHDTDGWAAEVIVDI